jgi:hypothetical protein
MVGQLLDEWLEIKAPSWAPGEDAGSALVGTL